MQKDIKIGDVLILSELANNKSVSWGAKVLLGVIRNFIVGNPDVDYCYAGNEYFAEMFGVTDRTITIWMGELEAVGAIRRYRELFNGTYQRRIRLSYEFASAADMKKNPGNEPQNFFTDQPKKTSGTARKKLRSGTEKNFGHSNNKFKNNNSNYPPKSPQGDKSENRQTEPAGGTDNEIQPSTEKTPKRTGRRNAEKSGVWLRADGYIAYGDFRNVWLLPADYEKLQADYGADRVQNEIEALSAWLARDNKKCDDYRAALLDFLIRHKPKISNLPKTGNDFGYRQREYAADEFKNMFDDLNTLEV